MQDIRWKAFWQTVGFSLLCLILGAITQPVLGLALFSVFLVLVFARQVYWTHQLYAWLENPNTNIPAGSGVWEDIFSLLYKNQRDYKRSHAELLTTIKGFKRATNALPDGIVVLNGKNEIEWCNPTAEKLLGVDIDRDIGQAIHNLVRYQKFNSYLHSDQQTEPLIIKSLRDQETTLQIELVPYGTMQKLMICRDITAQEKTDTMRRDFIANVSHELRTPLTVVGGFLETLMDTRDAIADSTRDYFDMMIDQTGRMRRIIEDLLMLSRIESNAELPADSLIKMSPLLNMIQKDALALSAGKHEVMLNADPQLNINGNQEELLSAFTNLVSNAIRYTPTGGQITIDWQLRKDRAVFSVRDTGIGIEEHHIARLTERFYRVDRGRSRDTGGTGLGLAIVKHILNRHKAKLEISSQPGAGSTFSIVFPASRTLQDGLVLTSDAGI